MKYVAIAVILVVVALGLLFVMRDKVPPIVRLPSDRVTVAHYDTSPGSGRLVLRLSEAGITDWDSYGSISFPIEVQRKDAQKAINVLRAASLHTGWKIELHEPPLEIPQKWPMFYEAFVPTYVHPKTTLYVGRLTKGTYRIEKFVRTANLDNQQVGSVEFPANDVGWHKLELGEKGTYLVHTFEDAKSHKGRTAICDTADMSLIKIIETPHKVLARWWLDRVLRLDEIPTDPANKSVRRYEVRSVDHWLPHRSEDTFVSPNRLPDEVAKRADFLLDKYKIHPIGGLELPPTYAAQMIPGEHVRAALDRDWSLLAVLGEVNSDGQVNSDQAVYLFDVDDWREPVVIKPKNPQVTLLDFCGKYLVIKSKGVGGEGMIEIVDSKGNRVFVGRADAWEIRTSIYD